MGCEAKVTWGKAGGIQQPEGEGEGEGEEERERERERGEVQEQEQVGTGAFRDPARFLGEVYLIPYEAIDRANKIIK